VCAESKTRNSGASVAVGAMFGNLLRTFRPLLEKAMPQMKAKMEKMDASLVRALGCCATCRWAHHTACKCQCVSRGRRLWPMSSLTCWRRDRFKSAYTESLVLGS
jgi:hypothetical protein